MHIWTIFIVGAWGFWKFDKNYVLKVVGFVCVRFRYTICKSRIILFNSCAFVQFFIGIYHYFVCLTYYPFVERAHKIKTNGSQFCSKFVFITSNPLGACITYYKLYYTIVQNKTTKCTDWFILNPEFILLAPLPPTPHLKANFLSKFCNLITPSVFTSFNMVRDGVVRTILSYNECPLHPDHFHLFGLTFETCSETEIIPRTLNHFQHQ